jgi:hypothetical protein
MLRDQALRIPGSIRRIRGIGQFIEHAKRIIL